MAQFLEVISPDLIEFIREQPVVFVATAAAQGRVNVSPKGMDTVRVLDDQTVGYLDLTGSGAETVAHIRHDGRLTMMWCSFGMKPMILRLYGRGEVITPNDPAWSDVMANFKPMPGQRQIILLHVESAMTSCGFGVPRMELIEPRNTLSDWATKKGDDGLHEYRSKKNRRSIDGLSTGLFQQ